MQLMDYLKMQENGQRIPPLIEKILHEIIVAAYEGQTNREIADSLGLHKSEVKLLVRRYMRLRGDIRCAECARITKPAVQAKGEDFCSIECRDNWLVVPGQQIADGVGLVIGEANH